MNTELKELLGADAAKFYEHAGYEVETWAAGRRGIVRGNGEYVVSRKGLRWWEVKSEGRRYRFGSQWELLAWLSDRI